MNPLYVSRAIMAVTVVVTLAWFVSFLAPLIQADYKPPQEVHILMMAVIGLLTNLALKANKAAGKDGDDAE